MLIQGPGLKKILEWPFKCESWSALIKNWHCHGDGDSNTIPGLSTGVMNHVDKDSRPDLLKGINVKVEPGWEQSLKLARTAHRDRGGDSPRSGLCHHPSHRHMAVDQRHSGTLVTGSALTFRSLYKWVQGGWAGWGSSILPMCICCDKTVFPSSLCKCIQNAGSCGTSAEKSQNRS